MLASCRGVPRPLCAASCLLHSQYPQLPDPITNLLVGASAIRPVGGVQLGFLTEKTRWEMSVSGARSVFLVSSQTIPPGSPRRPRSQSPGQSNVTEIANRKYRVRGTPNDALG